MHVFVPSLICTLHRKATNMIKVKICGIRTEEILLGAIEAGADFIGFVFKAGTPRYITPFAASELVKPLRAKLLPEKRKLVAVMVDPTDQELANVLSVFPADILQLHGNESPGRLREIGKLYDVQLMKALSIATTEDLLPAADYVGSADMLLFDTKAPAGEHGGTGKTFDWSLLDGFSSPLPWFLSGGLNADNIEDAIYRTHTKMVDVSSGVERERGVKDLTLVQAFIAKAKGIQNV